MKTMTRIVIVAAVLAAAAPAFIAKQPKQPPSSTTAGGVVAATANETVTAKLPKLLDLGAGKCIPCKMMKPILDDLKVNYADCFITEFIDVWENPDAGKKYGVEVIPTQIFYDAEGKELFRHVGFYGKEDILAKWKELGVDAGGKSSAAIVREQPVAADTRPRNSVCSLCDESIAPKTRTLVKGDTEQRLLCSPHCYFIYFTSLVGAEANAVDAKVSVADWAGGHPIPATTANYL